MNEPVSTGAVSEAERTRLLHMVTQVAQFFEPQVVAAQLPEVVAAHLRQQWSPLLRQRFLAAVADEADGQHASAMLKAVAARLCA